MKIKTFFILFVLIALLSAAAMFLTFHSCTRLEEEISGMKLFELNSEVSIEAALAPIYGALRDAYRNPIQRITTFGGDDITTWWAGAKNNPRIFDSFN